jgi:uncharacterized coiled-coil DUF342 family protein
MTAKHISKLFQNWKAVKSNVSKFVNPSTLKDVQGQVKAYVKSAGKTAQKDFSNLKKFVSEKKEVKNVLKQVHAELNKAQKFVATQSKELKNLQSKLEKFVPKKKAAKRSVKAKARTTKKATRKSR